MSLAKAPEAEMYEVQYLALMVGAALLLGAALYTAVRLWQRRGAVLLSIGLAVAALGPVTMIGSMWLGLSRGAAAASTLAVGLMEITAAVMIVLAVPPLLGRNRFVDAEVEGTA
ncbi:hypothetical protein [Actinocrispum sp. NPDC049592]|uniref:hypothetical protein n=1 Tax=Actinocrispum sp. NPDC049592 TaxID=3154835 RepID=UPI00341B571C